jgi:periplasmic divalent cation tolerance protein
MRVVLCTCPPDRAEAIARGLVERGAACVNIVPAVRSIYRWQGAIHDDAEALLVVKAAADRVETLRAALGELHPYELPEWVVLTPDAGLTSAAYAAWVQAGG